MIEVKKSDNSPEVGLEENSLVVDEEKLDDDVVNEDGRRDNRGVLRIDDDDRLL